MSPEMPGGHSSNPAPHRPPYLLVAGVLALVVALLLGGGLFLSQRTQPARHAAVVASPSVPATARPVPAQPAASFPPPTAVALLSTPTAPSPSAAASPGASFGLQVARTPLERQIEAAYLHYWDVYTAEAAKGDTSQLSQVLAGDALKWITDEIDERSAQGRGVSIQVKHQYVLKNVTKHDDLSNCA